MTHSLSDFIHEEWGQTVADRKLLGRIIIRRSCGSTARTCRPPFRSCSRGFPPRSFEKPHKIEISPSTSTSSTPRRNGISLILISDRWFRISFSSCASVADPYVVLHQPLWFFRGSRINRAALSEYFDSTKMKHVNDETIWYLSLLTLATISHSSTYDEERRRRKQKSFACGSRIHPRLRLIYRGKHESAISKRRKRGNNKRRKKA